jgi:hypothetical protein
MKIKVFIGSSRESQAVMDDIEEWIESFGHVARPWTDNSVFPLGATTFASLHQVARVVDAAIFIFGEDDTIWYRGDKTASPRDNVLLEYGLFSGALGEKSVAIALKGHPKLASDLLGITYLPMDTRAAARNKLKFWLEGIASGGTDAHPTGSRLSSTFQSAGKKSLFEQGTALIRRAHRRVALVAKTPIPIVGTRPYGEPAHAIEYEKTQFEEYMNLARAASGGASPEFCCVGSLSALREDINNVAKDAFTVLVHSNLIELDWRSRGSGSKFHLRWCEDQTPTTFVVADDSFLLWFKDGGGENVWITAENDVIARALWDHANRLSRTVLVEDIATLVGILAK